MIPQPTPPVHSTFVLERSFPHAPDRIFALLATPNAKRRWFLEDPGTTIDHFEMDFRVGGTELARYSYHNGSPVDGLPFTNEGTFFDIVPDRRVVTAFSMSLAGRRISVTLVTFDLRPVEAGTALTVIHQGVFFEGADGPRLRELGWIKLVDRLEAASRESRS
jgi:uncharacterized protein YndB with AHSA1/START domain